MLEGLCWRQTCELPFQHTDQEGDEENGCENRGCRGTGFLSGALFFN